MAKAEVITQDTNITINPSSKNKVYEYGTEGITLKFDGGFISDKGKEIYGYEDRYNNFAIRKKDDLVLTTLFTKDNGKTKKVTTTVKNFFADDSKNYMLNYKTYADYERYFDVTVPNWLGSPIKPNTEQGSGGLYAESGVETGPSYYLGSTKNDNVEFTTDFSEYSYDTKGNDTYSDNVANAKKYAWDMAGNDTYSVHNGGNLYVSDYKGNDIYGAGDDYSRIIVVDYSGKDDYRINPGSKFDLHDYAGNDIYSVYKNTVGDLPYIGTIADDKGNDRYVIDQATLRINDTGGKDKYEVNNTATLEISDSGKGNDTVVVKDCYNLEYGDFYISNANGNETYTLDNVNFDGNSYASTDGCAVNDENGNDKYNINNSEYLIIKDEKGKDKYTVSNTEYAYFFDESGNDKYSIIDGNYIHTIDESGNDKYNVSVTENCPEREYIYLKDKAGKDNYTLTGIENRYINRVEIFDSSNSKSSKDKYNISYTRYANIADYGGSDTYSSKQSRIEVHDYGECNDTYKIDKLQLTEDEYGRMNGDYIWDHGGKDSLTISGLNKNDVVFMTNYTKDASKNYRDEWCNLIIYDKTNKGCIQILQFYADNDENGSYDGYGDGRIETIKAGKKALKNIPTADYFTDSMRAQVGAWLSNENHAYNNVCAALTSGNDISELIQIFQGG